MRELPAGTLTLLRTDIEGSTNLLHALDDGYADVLAQHRDILRAAFAWYGGVEVDTQGDAFFVVFARASLAVGAAVAAQRSLANDQWPRRGAVRVRMGLHTGEPQRTDGGYTGLDVHRAARICEAAHGGQVLLSQVTAALTEQKLPPGVQLRNLGEHRLKDLIQPEQLFQLVVDGLPADFPSIRSLDSRPNNLPTPVTSFIGRDGAVAELAQLLRRDDVRLLTLTGPSGTGKTRLGLRAATELLHDMADGVWFVPLAPVRDPAFVLPTIAQALGMREAEGRTAEHALVGSLRDKQMLLILDNFEQVVEAATRVPGLLATCPRLKVLVTSRASLRVSGEREYPVPPLALPDRRRHEPAAVLSQYAAVRLFIERAVAVRPDFTITNESAPAVAEICARLDGLPLAIELAAARIRFFPPQSLLSRLDRRLATLTDGPRDLPDRQRTLRAAIGWSYELLTAEEQRVFRRLGIFVGGWALDAADAICSDDDASTPDTLDELSSLAEKSLIKQEPAPDGALRFTMLETIREYALQQLETTDEAETLRERHARYFIRLGEETEGRVEQPDWFSWLTKLDADHDNLRTALHWCDEDPARADLGLRMAAGLRQFWFLRGYFTEGRRWLERMLDRTDGQPTPARAHALYGLAKLIWNQNDVHTAEARLREGLAVARYLGDDRAAALALNLLGQLILDQGRGEEARSVAEESVRRFRALNDVWGLGQALTYLGNIAFEQGEYPEARAALEEALALFVGRGDRSQAAWLQRLLGHVALHAGDLPAARALFLQSLETNETGGEWRAVAACIAALAGIEASAGRLESAARRLGAAASLLERVEAGGLAAPMDGVEYERNRHRVRTALGDARFARAWEAGHALSLEQVLQEVRREGTGPVSR